MEKELQISLNDFNEAIKNSEDIQKQFHDFEQLMMMYNCAIKEVLTKFEVLNDDMSLQRKRNPIEMIKSRVKRPESIAAKMRKRGLDISITSMMDNIHDVAGVRVICSFVDDIYEIADMLSSQDDITVIEVKDYIKNPKKNGYRSYHMIVEIPVFFSSKKQNVKVEIQLRTIAMDFWASLEHKMKYKKDAQGMDFVESELKKCADSIAENDIRMQEINRMIEEIENQ